MANRDPLPRVIRKAAIQYSREKTGIQRPCKENAPLVQAWEDCYIFTRKYLRGKNGKKD